MESREANYIYMAQVPDYLMLSNHTGVWKSQKSTL